MIIDTLENIDQYQMLHPSFAQVFDYLKTADLNAIAVGTKIHLKEDELIVNFSLTEPKTKEQAQLETHRKFIDIQIPLSDVEIIGYTPLKNLPESIYDAEKDITFYDFQAESLLTIKPGMFVILWPQDAHAPGISEKGVKKIVIKVLA